MATPLLSQCEVFTKPCLLSNVINADRSAHGKLSFSQSHSTSSSKVFCSSRIGREAGKTSQFRSGVLLRNEKCNAKVRTSNISQRSVRCEAHSASRVEATDYGYDLYELLGVEKDSQAEEIKRAYRWLQKRCHPDVAGPKGHDMAILLNEAYAILSDPHRRASYDATCAERDEFEGYTGNPLYSRWYGKPGEDRAVFVEETRCIGCLKCALIAPDTFAIEAKYGRARAVGQWLDDEGTIKDAIRACPVDCISWVKKDMIPALEFIMSRQPRLNMGVNNFSYVGVRRENVFQGADKFLKKYAKREELKNASGFQETTAQREARMAAVEAINIKAGRWWWHDLMGLPNLTFSNLWDSEAPRVSQGALVPIATVRPTGSSNRNQFVDTHGPEDDPNLGPLFEAAKQRRRRGTTGSSKAVDTSEEELDEYWTPSEPISCPLPIASEVRSPSTSGLATDGDAFVGEWTKKGYKFRGNVDAGLRRIMSAVPVLVSVAAAVMVGMNGGSDLALSETRLINGPLPISVITGVELQLLLTAVVWYMIGAVFCEVALFMTTAFVSVREKKNQD